MMSKLALVLLSTLAQTVVFAEASSTRLGQNDMNVQANIVVDDELVSPLQVPETGEEDLSTVKPRSLRALNGNNDGSGWDHGTYSVAHHSGNLKVYIPPATKVGDTIFLFLRYVFLDSRPSD